MRLWGCGWGVELGLLVIGVEVEGCQGAEGREEVVLDKSG
jgi:hypothetical protein